MESIKYVVFSHWSLVRDGSQYLWTRPSMVAWYWYLTIIPKVRFAYEVGVGYNYLIFNTREWNNCFIIIFLKLQTSGYYNWILVSFILNITKRPDINLTSGKPRENHITCVLFANLVEWIIWKGRTLCLNYSLDKYCFCFPSLWLWNSTLDRSTWLPFNFVFFLHWIGAAQRSSFINHICCYCCSTESLSL